MSGRHRDMSMWMAGLMSVVLVSVALVAAGVAGPDQNAAEPIQGEERAVLTDAPMVPPPITREHATKVVVRLEVVEVEMPITEEVYKMVVEGKSPMEAMQSLMARDPKPEESW